MTNNLVLMHHGIKGQRWGVIRTPEQLGHVTGSKKSKASDIDKKSVKDLSDDELRTRLNRLNMEEQYANLQARQKERNTGPIKKMLANAAQRLAQNSINAAVDKFVEKLKSDDFDINAWRDANLDTMDNSTINKVSKWYSNALLISNARKKIKENSGTEDDKKT